LVGLDFCGAARGEGGGEGEEEDSPQLPPEMWEGLFEFGSIMMCWHG